MLFIRAFIIVFSLPFSLPSYCDIVLIIFLLTLFFELDSSSSCPTARLAVVQQIFVSPSVSAFAVFPQELCRLQWHTASQLFPLLSHTLTLIPASSVLAINSRLLPPDFVFYDELGAGAGGHTVCTLMAQMKQTGERWTDRNYLSLMPTIHQVIINPQGTHCTWIFSLIPQQFYFSI